MDKRDYLGECNEHAVPEDQFREAFCVRCLQPECSRSALGKSQFEARVSTWAERLFTNVPRLSPEDPRYLPLANQKFVSIDVGRTPEIQSWIDPLAVAASDGSLRGDAVQPEPAPVAVPESASPEPVRVQTEPQQAQSRVPRHMVLANAQDQSGRMLAGTSRTPPKDPWASPEPTKSAGTVVSAGARVKLGGSGV